MDGLKDSISHSCRNLHSKVEVIADGNQLTLSPCEEVVILNVNSYAGGISLWPTGRAAATGERGPSLTDDGKFEVVTVTGSFQMGAAKFGLQKPACLGQYSQMVIRNTSEDELPLQVDGEPKAGDFKVLTVDYIGQASMLRKDKNAVPESFKAPPPQPSK